MLGEQGVAVIEVPYLIDLIEKCEFDTIYHQHLCYFSVAALDSLFRRHGLFLNDVERTSIHGGSLRLYVQPFEDQKASVAALLGSEKLAGSTEHTYYLHFANNVVSIKERLTEILGKSGDLACILRDRD
jgi:hypothetical protein